jgi:cystathionine beta-lyase/cystathionine gamma-synthase
VRYVWPMASVLDLIGNAPPALMTHGSVPPEVRATLGINDTLVRLSVGIEDADDLIADLSAAPG